MCKLILFFTRALCLIVIFSVSNATLRADQTQSVDKSIVDHYINRTIVSMHTLDAYTKNVVLDDGSIWWWVYGREKPPENLVGTAVRVQWKPEYFSGYYIFVTPDEPTKDLIGRPLYPTRLPLFIEEVEVLSYEKVREPSYLEKLAGLEGYFKVMATVTLSDKSNWLISIVRGPTTVEGVARPPAYVGSDVVIIWVDTSDGGVQPVMMASLPMRYRQDSRASLNKTLIIEGTR